MNITTKLKNSLSNGTLTLFSADWSETPIDKFLTISFSEGLVLNSANLDSSSGQPVVTGTATFGTVSALAIATFSTDTTSGDVQLSLSLSKFSDSFSLSMWLTDLQDTVLARLSWDNKDLCITLDSNKPKSMSGYELSTYLGSSFTPPGGTILGYTLSVKGTPLSDAGEFFSFWSATTLQLSGFLASVSNAPLVVVKPHGPLSASFQNTMGVGNKLSSMPLNGQLQFISVGAIGEKGAAKGYGLVSTTFSGIEAYAYVKNFSFVDLSFNLEATQRGGVDIASLLEKTFPVFNLKSMISSDFPYLDKLEFNSLRIGIFRPLKKLSNISLKVTVPNDTWNILPGVVSLSHLSAILYMANPLDAEYRSSSLWLSATAELDKVKFSAQVNLFSLDFSLGMQANQSIDITSYLEEIIGASVIKPPSLVCKNLNVLGGKKGLTYLGGALDTKWTLMKGVELSDINFSLVTGVSTTFSGSISIGDIKLSAQCVFYAGQSNAGWMVRGQSAAGQSIKIGTLIKDLASQFGIGSVVPAPIKDFTIDQLNMNFNTATRNVSFSCDGSLPIDGKTLQSNITFDLSETASGTHEVRFGGQLQLSQMEFDLIFSSDNADKTFMAVFSDAQGLSVMVQDLVKEISSDLASDVPAGLSFTVNDAMLAYMDDPGSGANASKWLFGLEMGGGINLSNFRSLDLPILH